MATGRVLLADTKPSATSIPLDIQRCPLRINYNNKYNNLTMLFNPTCKGRGFAAHQKAMQLYRKAAAFRARQCGVAFDNKTSLVINSIPLKSCIPRATPRAELDARDEARSVAPRASPTQGPEDFYTKVKKLTQAVCYFESQADCDVDTSGTTDWYQKYFKVSDSACSAHASCCPLRQCLSSRCGIYVTVDPQCACRALCMPTMAALASTLCFMLHLTHTHTGLPSCNCHCRRRSNCNVQ